MKLSELTEAAGTDLDFRKLGPNPNAGQWKIPVVTLKDDTRPSERGRQLGQGRQAKAFELPNKPGAIIKHIRVNEDFKDDPHASFINLALRNQDNPFFPKIYNAKIYANKGKFGAEHAPGEKTLVVQMEKLHKINSPAMKEGSESLLASLGIGPDTSLGYKDDHDNRLWQAFESSTRRMELAENTKNPHLAKAIYALEPMFLRHDNDVMAQNMMIRLTSVGPHLVFTDPF